MANLKDLLVNGSTNHVGRNYSQTPALGTKDRQVATTEFVLDNCYKPPLLSFMWADHLLNDMSWLRADTFSWQDGTTYSSAYNELLVEYNNSASVEETEGSITFKRTPKGYKIALATQENAILNLYNTTGVAWYYIIDTTNQRFKLPRMKHKYWKDQSTIPVMGNGNAIGYAQYQSDLQNKTAWYKRQTGHEYGVENRFVGSTNTTTPYSSPVSVGTAIPYNNNYNNGTTYGLTNNPELSGVVADVSDVNIETGFYLYFYVGEFARNSVQQTAGLNSELFNGKMDINHANDTKPYITDTYTNGPSWYRVWSDGWCEQGGQTATTGAASTVTTVNFLKPFANANYCALATDYATTTTVYYFGCTSFTTSSMAIISSAGADRACRWMVAGYIN